MTSSQSAIGHGPGQRHDHTAALQDGLDFVNTLAFGREGETDHLPAYPAAVRWFDEHQLLHREMVEQQLRRHEQAADSTETVMRRIRRVRRALRELVEATVERRPADAAALREVNRAMRTHYIYELVPAPDGVSLDHRHEGDPIDGALARLTESIARELTKAEAERLRICANEQCRWAFYDSSPAGRRRWCDMATCGNRAKVARHRARRREQDAVAG